MRYDEAHQRMLSILDLEKITVEDIMVPRNEINGTGHREAEWDEIVHQLQSSQHTRMPVYEGGIDKMLGFVHARQVIHLLSMGGRR